jgi:hypothetical protein
MADLPTFDPYDKNLTTNRRILHWRQIGDQEAVSPSAIAHAKYGIEDLHIRDLLVARLTAWVLMDHICERRQTVTLETPASWWQHFKRDALPKRITRSNWFRKHIPVILTETSKTITFSEDRMYADYCELPERFGQPVIVETVTKTSWEKS